MNKNSNSYIFMYSTILVVIVAVLLSAANVFLSPYQKKNERAEKMKNILTAAGIKQVENDNAEAMFKKYCTQIIVIDSTGQVVENCTQTTECTAININLKDELYRKSKGKTYQLPIYVIEKDGKKISVLPLQGTGLWGPIWGYLSLSDDNNTLMGAVFDHKSETPGLGGEITTEKFSGQFAGKTIFQDGKFVSVNVQKGGIARLDAQQQQHSVDAISGATITSTGVKDMINKVLSAYMIYFEK